METREDYKLFRCKFLREGKEFIKAKDYNGNTFYIKRSKNTKGYKKGFDDTFYAKLERKGIIFKKRILHVIDFNDYLALK